VAPAQRNKPGDALAARAAQVFLHTYSRALFNPGELAELQQFAHHVRAVAKKKLHMFIALLPLSKAGHSILTAKRN